MENTILDYGVVEKLARSRRREAARLSLLLREADKPRGGRRSLRDAVRLAEIAVDASRAMLEVVAWGKAWEKRVLKLKQ
ncbi:hypothetical protein [Pyrodictium abyssi]|uniref:Uncharacterized protein n=1 Tax=Pyrodictium abyssi TaxID=54256 RepID=A0ABN6ZTW7_9CREN|nr:hypothetical protein PABY_18670 [Pyrodictium abyssi]